MVIYKEGSMTNNATLKRDPFGQRLGLMYKRWVLDCIPQVAHAVSLDFSQRPERYKRVGPKTANLLTDMQSQYGYAPNFPNQDARLMLMKPLFGASDGQMSRNDGSAFYTRRMQVLAAAAGFAENAQPTGFPMHRDSIRTAIVPLRTLMADFEGASLDQTDLRMGAIFDTAAAILRDAGVTAVFGISEEIADAWPLNSTPLNSTDSEGSKLVEEITRQLLEGPQGLISRDRFVNMQRVAEKGFQSILRILETAIESDDGLLDLLIAQLYAWGSGLKVIGGARPQ
jgi:hypothetical protein